ncbi:hypothetical protein D3C80_1541590 [compost metagenome]
MRDYEIAARNAKGETFKVQVLLARPDLTFTKFEAGWPRITCIAHFTFPGAQYGGSCRDQEGNGNLEWYIANGDKDAWAAYEEGRKAA